MTILLSPLSGIAPARKEAGSASQTGKNAGAPALQQKKLPENSAATPEQKVPDAPANVTFRRDASGRVFYVLTDAQTGKELQELPPEEVRKAGDGIAQYLKQEEARSASHLNVKG